jgi:hypothetical protein
MRPAERRREIRYKSCWGVDSHDEAIDPLLDRRSVCGASALSLGQQRRRKVCHDAAAHRTVRLSGTVYCHKGVSRP